VPPCVPRTRRVPTSQPKRGHRGHAPGGVRWRAGAGWGPVRGRSRWGRGRVGTTRSGPMPPCLVGRVRKRHGVERALDRADRDDRRPPTSGRSAHRGRRAGRTPSPPSPRQVGSGLAVRARGACPDRRPPQAPGRSAHRSRRAGRTPSSACSGRVGSESRAGRKAAAHQDSCSSKVLAQPVASGSVAAVLPGGEVLGEDEAVADGHRVRFGQDVLQVQHGVPPTRRS
jgi:hypothetical protein